MKAILEFDLPEEKEEFESATNGTKYYCALFDFKEKLFYQIDEVEMSEEKLKHYEEIFDMFLKTLEHYEVYL